MVVTGGVGFHIDVTAYLLLLLVGLDVNCTVLLAIKRVLVVSILGETVVLAAVGCRVEFCFGVIG